MEGRSIAVRRVLAAAVPLVLLVGCSSTPQETTTQSEVDALRADIEQLRNEVRAAQQTAATAAERAERASQAAEAAAAQAREASDRADRIYRQSLRK